MSGRRRGSRAPGALRLALGAAVGAAERRARLDDEAEAVLGALVGVVTVACITPLLGAAMLQRVAASSPQPVPVQVTSRPIPTSSDVIEAEIVEVA